jgi:hypothetical protein
MPQEATTWHPPQEKIVSRLFTGASIFAVVVGASLVIKTFVPTISDALALLQKLLANTITTAITAGALAATLWVLYETFSPKGKINGLFAQAYSSFIHNITLELLNVDPMSPLKDSLAAVQKKKAYYDEQFAVFDGQISKLNESINTFTDKAKKSESRAKAAQTQGNKTAFDQAAYESGSARETADDLAKMAARLITVRTVIVRLQDAANDLIYKLGIDIESTQIRWDTAKSMSGIEGAARSIISSGGKSDLAKEAQAIVQSKYAVAIGRLENLNDTAMPLLNSMDMDKATYSQELLDKWDAEDHSPIAIPMTATILAPGQLAAPAAAQGSNFRDLIGRQ